MRAFISWNSDQSKNHVASIRGVLKKNNIKTVDIFDIPQSETMNNFLEDRIAKSDLFISIIDNFSPNSFYEIGIAKGLNKPIFIVISKDLKIHPNFLYDFLYVRVSENESEIIEFPLNQFISNCTKNKRRSQTKNKKKDIKLPISSDLQQTVLRSTGTGEEITEYLMNIFELNNITVKTVSQNKGVDFVLWIDEMNEILGNILMIEVKIGNITKEMLNNSESELQTILRNTNNKVGLLLYLDRIGRRFDIGNSLDPLIIRMDIEDFIKEIGDKSISDVIFNCRDLIAHGKEE
ncbi:nucleoside 2-deoxyribosyltransferase [Bacillus sp. ISL-39]|uniref:nucleoside 2-deoxyribosyltransferase n=1 Tax=Bacillus sp. ISL-39 TaxID=2819124 RepID=UPI001BE64852|nr:nucleoside 2-deoxyribosyltransferase [Bacillus sp. ISL-39]MBT2639853.1 hypothetical protein [Bacillus sp. ISL-39]